MISAHRNGHQLIQRLDFPPMDLPQRAAGTEMVCPCGEKLIPQRAGGRYVYYCWRSGHEFSEPAPFRPFQRTVRLPVKRCECASSCRWCGGRR